MDTLLNAYQLVRDFLASADVTAFLNTLKLLSYPGAAWCWFRSRMPRPDSAAADGGERTKVAALPIVVIITPTAKYTVQKTVAFLTFRAADS